MSHDAPPGWPPQQAPPPAIVSAIWHSADHLAREQDAFIRQLCTDVRGLIPQPALPPAFDLPAFCSRMAQALLWTALADQPLPVVAGTLRQVGAQNWLDGFPSEQYASFAHALVQTTHYLTRHDWSTSTGSAWISFFMWIRPHLLTGAEQAAIQDATARQEAAQEATRRRSAAEREAARVADVSRRTNSGHGYGVGDVNIERVASLLDDDDDEDDGYGQIMRSMTRNPLAQRNPDS